MNARTRIRVCVLHEDAVMAAGLSAILDEQVNVDLVVAPRVAPLDLPEADVVVADYRNGLSAVSTMQGIRTARGAAMIKVLIVTDIDSEWEVRSAISAGIRGYVLQGCPIDELVEGVMKVSQGQRYLSHSVARRIADGMSREKLTARETQVLHLLTTGSCNKSIARDLGIAVGTVKVHVKGIFEKLGAASRTHAVIVARELGLVRHTAPIAYGSERAGVRDLIAIGVSHATHGFYA